jgi:succinate dehydrogenase / fumarate reductase, cytochrome b subunit
MPALTFELDCRVNLIVKFYQSSIGKKWIVALTGIVLIGYVLGHLVGNLQVFAGPEKINRYAEFLHSQGNLLWVARIALLIAFVAHIVVTIQLTVENRKARPQAYEKKKRSKLATRTMALSGLLVLSFVIYHLLHLTVRATDKRFDPSSPTYSLKGEFDVFSMIVLGFQHPLVSGFLK